MCPLLVFCIVLAKEMPKLSMLQNLRRNLYLQEFLKVAKVQLYSYTTAWQNNTLEKSLWAKMRSIHYRILRVGIRDFKQKESKVYIDKTAKEPLLRCGVSMQQ